MIEDPVKGFIRVHNPEVLLCDEQRHRARNRARVAGPRSDGEGREIRFARRGHAHLLDPARRGKNLGGSVPGPRVRRNTLDQQLHLEQQLRTDGVREPRPWPQHQGSSVCDHGTSSEEQVMNLRRDGRDEEVFRVKGLDVEVPVLHSRQFQLVPLCAYSYDCSSELLAAALGKLKNVLFFLIRSWSAG
ncbi:hypothetical protein BS78_04G105900 [Paspalum vaginatum]|nr:hypothetical protein BS78_04G105900 [Paspalum vaginatum]